MTRIFGGKRPKAKPAGELPEWLRAFLLEGTRPERDTEEWSAYVHAYYFSGPDAMAKLWRLHRDAVRVDARALGRLAYGEMFERPDEAA